MQSGEKGDEGSGTNQPVVREAAVPRQQRQPSRGHPAHLHLRKRAHLLRVKDV